MHRLQWKPALPALQGSRKFESEGTLKVERVCSCCDSRSSINLSQPPGAVDDGDDSSVQCGKVLLVGVVAILVVAEAATPFFSHFGGCVMLVPSRSKRVCPASGECSYRAD